jgi:hypothetical protein
VDNCKGCIDSPELYPGYDHEGAIDSITVRDNGKTFTSTSSKGIVTTTTFVDAAGKSRKAVMKLLTNADPTASDPFESSDPFGSDDAVLSSGFIKTIEVTSPDVMISTTSTFTSYSPADDGMLDTVTSTGPDEMVATRSDEDGDSKAVIDDVDDFTVGDHGKTITSTSADGGTVTLTTWGYAKDKGVKTGAERYMGNLTVSKDAKTVTSTSPDGTVTTTNFRDDGSEEVRRIYRTIYLMGRDGVLNFLL